MSSNAFQTDSNIPSVKFPEKSFSSLDENFKEKSESSALFPIVIGGIVLLVGAGALFFSYTLQKNLQANITAETVQNFVTTQPVTPSSTPVPTSTPNNITISNTKSVAPTPIPSNTPTLPVAQIASPTPNALPNTPLTTPIVTTPSQNTIQNGNVSQQGSSLQKPNPPSADTWRVNTRDYSRPEPNVF